MNKQIKIVSLAVLVMSSATLMADQAPAKRPTRIDFNKMIDENNQQRAELQKDLSPKAKAKAEAQASDDKKKISDFVDVEVGWGKDRPTVVDRRFNSTGKPRIANIGQSDVTVQLISKKKAAKGS